LSVVADVVEAAHGEYLPWAVRIKAAQAAATVVEDWAAARKEDDAR
jgi:hypothetical protein